MGLKYGPSRCRPSIGLLGSDISFVQVSQAFSIIGTVELFFTFKSISGALYTYFEAATVTMIIYFILTFTCSRILRWVETKMDGPANFDLATKDTLAFTSGLTKYNKATGGTH